MLFAHDTEVALEAAAALVNTAPWVPDEPDALPDVAALDAFADEAGWTGHRASNEAELAQVQALRPRLRQLWMAEADEAVEGVNELLREAQALPQLVRHDQWDWHLHATDDQAPLATRMAVEAAMGLVDMIRSGELSRLQVCSAEDCQDVFIDLSRNRSRRYCTVGCGNRVAAAAYRARQQRQAAEER